MDKRIIILLAAIALAAILFMPLEMPENSGNANASYGNGSAEDNMSDYYPEHPTLADCEKTSKRDFCISDVAEINNDIDLCQQLQAHDIRIFCTARLSLNKTMCHEIADQGLSDSCMQSIEMKVNTSA